MRNFAFTAAAALLLASPSFAFQPHSVTDRQAGFSIVFPGKPTKESEYNQEIGAQVSRWELADHSGDEFNYYEVYLVEFPSGWQAHNPRQHAAAYADLLVGGSEILSNRDTTAGARGGREITARLVPDGGAGQFGARPQLQHVKVVTVGNKVYAAHARHLEGGPAAKARSFISSLRILK